MQHQRTPRSGLSAEHRALGFAVRETRARRGFSQEHLGFRSGLHRNYVGAIERGEINPTFRTLRLLTRGLGVELSYLIRICERNIAEAQQ
jgi:transcriptional regulator with XRE-family HTH domain